MHNSYNRAKDYIEKCGQNLSDSKSKTSEFWKGIFDQRSNIPSFYQMQFFRLPQYTLGLGTHEEVSEEEELKRFNQFITIILEYIDESYLLDFDEEVFGGAKLFNYKGKYYSTSFVMNTGTSYTIKKHIDKHLTTSKIKALEIGPGWGGVAHQLIQKNNISSYVLCDLPNNLMLSAFYLQIMYPEMNHIFISSEIKELKENTIYYTLPDFLSCIKDDLHLVINSFSLQEMEKSSAQSYITWISEHLTQNGIFISINSHGKAGIQNPNEYGFHQFTLASFKTFRKTPGGLYNTIPYELVLKKNNTKNQIDKDHPHFNVLCKLIQLGFDDKLSDYRTDVINNKIITEGHFLNTIDAFFKEKNYSKKEKLLKDNTDPEGHIITNTLLLMLYFINNENKKCLEIAKDFRLDQEQEYYKTFIAVILFYVKAIDERQFQERILINSPALAEFIFKEVKKNNQTGLKNFISNKIN